ncbi:MAG: hypothetical protein JSW55_19880 [Chloroflexota bacterium]|nr:MAG: hypothetical protein JSW55_19880 [Chloroflexota bacterium]
MPSSDVDSLARQKLACHSWWFVLPLLALLALVSACQNPSDGDEDPTATTSIAEASPEPSAVPEMATDSAYPPSSDTLTPNPYPVSGTPTPTRTPRPGDITTDRADYPVEAYLPWISRPEAPTPTPTPTPTETPSPTPTPTPTIDFRAVRAQLQAQGQDLGFAKLGFHAGVGGNRTGLGEWMGRLDAAGVPFFVKSVDDAGPLLEAQQIVRGSDTPHVLVFRRSGDEYDTPNYDLPPEEAARQHWQLHMEAFPAELDPNLVWLETINEVDKGRSEWLGRFALETARLAMADGFRWAAFGWSSGEPEVSDWQTPSMLAFLRLAAANPDRLAIALHEYSFSVDDIADQYPFKLGRFLQLYQVTDQLGLPRPTVLITEWGWEYQNVPTAGQALRDIDWAAAMYAPYPEVKGAAIWYLGIGFGDIAEQAQKLIAPVTEYSLGNYFAIPLPPERASISPESYRP